MTSTDCPENLNRSRHLRKDSRPHARRRRRRTFWRVVARDSGGGSARGLLRAWIMWEHFADYWWPKTPIPGAPYGLLKIRPKRYSGTPITLPDGTLIAKGDPIAVLHCDNRLFVTLAARGENRGRACRVDLKSLARWTLEGDSCPPFKALFGITMLWWAAARVGFVVRDRPPTIRNRLDGIFMGGMLLAYSTDGANRVRRGKALDSCPREIWLSRDDLLRHYGNAATAITLPASDAIAEYDPNP